LPSANLVDSSDAEAIEDGSRVPGQQGADSAQGLDPETIRARLADFNAFQYFQANIASIQSKYQH
jgi:hypothetical protein